MKILILLLFLIFYIIKLILYQFYKVFIYLKYFFYLLHQCWGDLDKCLTFSLNFKHNFSSMKNARIVDKKKKKKKMVNFSQLAIGLMSRVFTNGPVDQGSIPGRVIQKTQKMVLDAALLNTQYYKLGENQG